MIEQYLRTKGVYLSQSSIKIYRSWLNQYQNYNDFVSFYEGIKDSYSQGSIQLAMRVVKGYLQYCERHGIDCDSDDLRVPRAKINSHKPISAEEYVSMLSFIHVDNAKGVRDNALVRMLYDTGARIGEICSLTKQDINFEERSAEIWTEKTICRRLIVWGKDTNEFLETWCELIYSQEKIFPSTRTAERIIKKYAKLAKIEKKIVPHSFRHGKAHRILDSGGSVKDVQEALGHISPISSFRYLQFSRKKSLELLQKYVRKTKINQHT